MKKSIFLFGFIALFSTLIQAQSTELWGISTNGGEFNIGSIFKVDANGNNFSLKSSFLYNAGKYPHSSQLCNANNGFLYGTTNSGGANFFGVIYAIDTINYQYINIFNFDNVTTGRSPRNSLTLASNGKIYGLSFGGGTYNRGTLFELDPTTNTVSILHHFTNSDGKYPDGQLLEALTGKLYGTTREGGASNHGTLFEFNIQTGTFTKKIDFTPATGKKSSGGQLTLASNGKIYGLNGEGGSNNNGTLFEYTLSTNSLVTKVNFSDTMTGKAPVGSLKELVNGKLYGFTYVGGLSNYGTIFEYNLSSGILVKRHQFLASSTGRYPRGHLFQANDGNVYGTTYSGGDYNDGTIFKYDLSTHSLQKVFDFQSSKSGDGPCDAFIEFQNGKLIGVTNYGGMYNVGAIYQYDYINHKDTILCHIQKAKAGKFPETNLLLANNGKFYGMSKRGGDYDHGVLFELDPATSKLEALVQFKDTLRGKYPVGDLLQANNGLLYGLTEFGGTNNYGVLFSYNINTNVFTKIKDLVYLQTGVFPKSGLTQHSNGKLYGTFSSGANSLNYGAIYEIDPSNNSFSIKKYLSNLTVGRGPNGNLVRGSNGKLYGVCSYGGTYGKGTIIEYNPNNNYLVKKVDLDSARCVSSELILAGNGKFYGPNGISGKDGITEYNLSTNTLTQKARFPTNQDYGAYSKLVKSSNGKLYGVSFKGGTNDVGTIYEYDTANDTIIIKHSFNTSDGKYSQNGLTAVSRCVSVTNTLNVNLCGSYTTPSGDTTYTIPGNYTHYDTLSTNCGQDSIVIVHLNLFQNDSVIQSISACSSFTWIDGNIYTQSDSTASIVLQNVNGCDSVILLNLNIIKKDTFIQSVSACYSYTWIDGNTYTQSDSTGSIVLQNVNGCDSVVLLHLQIFNSVYKTDSLVACDSLTWIDGVTYYDDNDIAQFTYVGASHNNCDSIVHLKLKIIKTDLTVSISDPAIQANATNVLYQWLDCDSLYTPLANSNSALYTATYNGNFAVQINNQGCIDTSACFQIMTVSLPEMLSEKTFVSIYPNPSNGTIHLVNEANSFFDLQILNSLGQVVIEHQRLDGGKKMQLSLPPGSFIVILNNNKNQIVKRIVIL